MEDKKVDIKDIQNLVFEGGSTKGIAYLGALSQLSKSNFALSQLKRVAGTSAGAITAALIAVGYSANALYDELYNLNFEKFLDETQGNTRELLFGLANQPKGGILSSMQSASTQSISHPSAASQISSRISNAFGIYEGDKLRTWVEDHLYIKTGIRYLTFKELHILRGKNSKQYKDLFVPGVNLSTGYTEIFDYLHTPEVIISDAVRISLSIPLLFKPHTRYIKVINSSNKPERDVLQPAHVYTDGGVLNNYPVDIFDFVGFLDETVNVPETFWKPAHNPYTLGFRLISKTNIDYFTGVSDAPSREIEGLLPYLKALIATMYNKQNSDHQLHHDVIRSIYIDHLGIDTLAFDLSDAQKKALIQSGEKAVEDYLQKMSLSSEYKATFF